MSLANSTWYFKANEGAIFTLKVEFGPQQNDGGSVTINGTEGNWAEMDGLFTIELKGGPIFNTVWTGEFRGGAGSGFVSPEFNYMAFPFTMSTSAPSQALTTLDELKDIFAQRKAA